MAVYEIKPTINKGLGIFAICNIKRGTRILEDSPLLIIPKASYYINDIETAFAKLSTTDQATFLTLHSAHGQNPKDWPRHVYPTVSPAERQRIEEQHMMRTAATASVGSIFQTNAMEWNEGTGAAVFPIASRFNHSCLPNAFFAWNSKIGKETIHATKDIQAGEEITLCYCDPFHDVRMRRWELLHYGFICSCPACREMSEPGSIAATSHQRRYRLCELAEQAAREKTLVGALETVTLLIEEDLRAVNLGDAYFDIAHICESKIQHVSAHQAAVKGLQVYLDCLGADHPRVAAAAELVGCLKEKLAKA